MSDAALTDGAVPPGVGAGVLSVEARRRLARPRPDPVVPPDPTDRAAVSVWRERIHRAWLDGDPPAAELGHVETTVGGVRCLTVDRSTAGPIIVYFHGGGFALGSPEVAVPITDRLAGSTSAGTGLTLVSVDYRLSPEHPYPAAVEDGGAVVAAVTADNPGRPIVVAGDSAGANVATVVALRSPPARRVSGLLLFSPFLDLQRQRDPDDDPATVTDPLSDVDRRFGRWLVDGYLAGRSPIDPNFAPLLADLDPLPPTLVQVGTRDSTFPDAVRFCRRARSADRPVSLDVWDGLWHTWHYHRDLPEADRALTEANRFTRSCASPTT